MKLSISTSRLTHSERVCGKGRSTRSKRFNKRSTTSSAKAICPLCVNWRCDVSLSIRQRRRTITASVARLHYQSDNVLYRSGVLGRTVEARRLRRVDDRYGLGGELGVRLTGGLDLLFRYDLMVNDSNVDFAFDNKDFTKHTLTLSLAASL